MIKRMIERMNDFLSQGWPPEVRRVVLSLHYLAVVVVGLRLVFRKFALSPVYADFVGYMAPLCVFCSVALLIAGYLREKLKESQSANLEKPDPVVDLPDPVEDMPATWKDPVPNTEDFALLSRLIERYGTEGITVASVERRKIAGIQATLRKNGQLLMDQYNEPRKVHWSLLRPVDR